MISDFNIEELEQMAKFNIPEDEKKGTKRIMDRLVADFGKLSAVSTEGVKPLIHGIELENILREDKVIQNFDRDTLLENAPEHEKGYFKAPRTID